MTAGVQQALEDYLRNPSAYALLRLRVLIELPLIERLAILSVDRTLIAGALQLTWDLFRASASASLKVNWLVWITAHAMSFLVQAQGGSIWVDRVAGRISATPQDRRALVFGAILAMDGECQWVLLSSVWKFISDNRLTGCLRTLHKILRPLM